MLTNNACGEKQSDEKIDGKAFQSRPNRASSSTDLKRQRDEAVNTEFQSRPNRASSSTDKVEGTIREQGYVSIPS